MLANHRRRIAGCLANKLHCLLYSFWFFTNWWSQRHIWWNVLDKSLVTGVLELFPWLCRPTQDLSNFNNNILSDTRLKHTLCPGHRCPVACVCLVAALVIQPVLLRSVLRRFVHVTRSDNHLLLLLLLLLLSLLLLLFREKVPAHQSQVIYPRRFTIYASGFISW